MNKQTSGSGDSVSLSMGTLLGNLEGAPWELGGGSLTGDSEGKIKRDILSER